jgi:hypothetical protein
MNRAICVHNRFGGVPLQTNSIEFNQVVYEIHRVYQGKKTAANLVRDRLMESKCQISPLTQPPAVVYNNIDSGAGMSKEDQ